MSIAVRRANQKDLAMLKARLERWCRKSAPANRWSGQ